MVRTVALVLVTALATPRLLRTDVSQSDSLAQKGSLPLGWLDLLRQKAKDNGQKSLCLSSGDPHIRTFDANWKGGDYWHPMHAPGHWWVIRSEEEKLMVQVRLDRCGRKNAGGWMGVRFNGENVKDMPRTCNMGMSITGKNVGGHDFVIQTPCEWDWFNIKCFDGQEDRPRLLFDGEPVKADGELADTGVTAKGVNSDNVVLALADGTEFKISMWGFGGTKASAFNFEIRMDQNAAGKICGHCGNFDGNAGNDYLYTYEGVYKDPKANVNNALCDPEVECALRKIPELVQEGDPCIATIARTKVVVDHAAAADQDAIAHVELAQKGAKVYNREEVVGEQVEECDGDEDKKQATAKCEEQFAKIDNSAKDLVLKQQEFDDCVRDVCATGDFALAPADAQEAAADDQAEVEVFGAAAK